jgi:hypothetical protein
MAACTARFVRFTSPDPVVFLTSVPDYFSIDANIAALELRASVMYLRGALVSRTNGQYNASCHPF